jgi:hypothetical protein
MGNTVVGNSQTTDNTYDGILIDGSSNYNSVQGNTVRHAGGANQHKYGIYININTCNGTLVINNDLYLSGRTANLSDAGTGTIVRSNRGWATENSGTRTGTGAQETIPHGLNVIPNRVQLTDLEVGASPYQSAAPDATNIYTTAVLNQDYLWKAWKV